MAKNKNRTGGTAELDEDRLLEEAAAAPLEPQLVPVERIDAVVDRHPEALRNGEARPIAENIDELLAEEAADISRETPPPEWHEATIFVPVDDEEADGYVSTHLELRLSADQARGLHRLWRALNKRDDRTLNGKHVQSRADAVRWLLEEIANA